MTAFWLLRGFGTGLISQASHLLTFAILGVGHGLILQLGKRETLHFGPIGAGGPKNAVSLFPNCNIGSWPAPNIAKLKKWDPWLIRPVPWSRKGSRFLVFFCLLLSFGLRSLNGDGDDDDDAKFKNPKAAVRRPWWYSCSGCHKKQCAKAKLGLNSQMGNFDWECSFNPRLL